ncbi:unnamed protein product, partial [Brenthis ino]
MKLIVLLTVIAISNAAKLGKTYLPPHAQSSGGSEFLEAPISRPIYVADIPTSQETGSESNSLYSEQQQSVNELVHVQKQANIAQSNVEQLQNVNYHIKYEERPERPQAAYERHAAILRQEYQNNGESYAYAYETENGISADESGVAINGVKAHGGFSYTGDDGKQYSISYTADENGFRPQGDHLPTPHPIPAEILESLEKNARDEAAGIYDDGSYDERKYGEESSYSQYITNSNKAKQANYVNVNEQQPITDEDSIVTHAAPASSGGYRSVVIQNIQDLDYVEANAPQEASNAGVHKAYLPPVAQTSNGEITKTYLPSIAHKVIQDRSSQNGQFGSRNRKPSFSKKSGYQY